MANGVNRRQSHNRLDLVGLVFGNLLVLRCSGTKPVGKEGEHKSVWLCMCKCGTTRIMFGSSLTTGNSRSCGCINRERRRKNKVHGTRTYRIWQAMLNRCRNNKGNQWHRYGGRGIGVCERWKTYANFISDMGESPPSMSIDRIDNDGDYCPENCRWATGDEQKRNTSKNRWLELNGERKILKDWADQLGMDQSSLRERLEKMPLEMALTKPKSR